MISSHKILNTIALLSLSAVGFALFSQHVLEMQPCAWCVLQRFLFLCIAAICLLANFFRSKAWVKVCALLCFALSASGILSAWYQYSVASELFSCNMTFADKFMSQWTGLDATLPWLFGIFATCMDARVSLLGFDYSLWGLGLFAVFIVLTLWVLIRREPRELFNAL